MRRPCYAAVSGLALLLAGCAVGPDYHRPLVAIPAQYKEMPGWAQAAPADAVPKGDWWTDFDDPLLDQLEPLVAVSNETVRQDYANYEQSRALVQEAEGQLFPTLGLSGSVVRERTQPSAGYSTALGADSQPLLISAATAGGNASWEPDIWGKVRRTVEESQATAQESQATLANATLSEQAALANDIVDLRTADAETRLLQQTVAAYQASLRITQNQANAGTAAPSDVVTAETQLEGAQSSLINAGVARVQYQHAIAVLVGELPESLSVPPDPTMPGQPTVPVGVPSTLLERRPNIAADERAVAAANAAIGVQIAAFYPTITLSASGGWSGTPIGALFSAANQVWSLGTDASLDLFEGGARSAAVAAARDQYDAAVVAYRGDVLTAFQQIEDQLSSLRILAQQQAVADAAVRSASRGATIALNEYQAGTQAYTTVVTAQETLLSDQQSALTVRQNRLLAAVSLIEALGGGWSADELSGRPAPDILP